MYAVLDNCDCRLLAFFQNLLLHKFFFWNTVRVSNGLDLDQDRWLLVRDSPVTVLCPCARHFIRCLVLVQPRKTGQCPNMTEK